MKKSIYKTFKVLSLLLTFNLLLLTSFCFSQGGAAINTTGAAADASAMLDVSGVSKGVLINRMNTAERNAILNPAIGLQIFNIDCETIEIYLSNGWEAINKSNILPSTPIAATHTKICNNITWNWNSVIGAIGYKYNTINDYSTAYNNGNNISYSHNYQNYDTSFTLYVWAYNNCGHSSVATFSETISFTCGCDIYFNYNNLSVNYGTVNGDYNNGQYCWLDRNLGAKEVATSVSHYNSYGDLFQWGRLDDGHQLRSPLSGTTTTQSNLINPGHPLFIQGSFNWYSGSNPDNLWQGLMGINNPCPLGWRIPTEIEFNNERLTWNNQNYYGALNSNIKLSSGGFRHESTGDIMLLGNYGSYWSSSVGINGVVHYLYFNNNDASMYNYGNRASGLSARCIKDN